MSLSAACNSAYCESFISDLHSTITVWTRSSLPKFRNQHILLLCVFRNVCCVGHKKQNFQQVLLIPEGA